MKTNKVNTSSLVMIVTALLLTTLTVTAQGRLRVANNNEPYKTSFTLETGFNFFTLTSDTRDYESEFGLSAGFLLRTNLSRKTALTYGLSFVRKGAESDINDDGFFNGEIDYNLNYLVIPINLNYRISPKIILKGGLYYGRLVEANFDYDGVFVNGFGEFDDDDFQKNDLGAILGIAYEIGRFQIGLQFQRGFIDITDTSILQDNLGETRNTGFGITLIRFF